MATLAMLAGVEPRPNERRVVSPQRRHLGLSTEQIEKRRVPVANVHLYRPTHNSSASHNDSVLSRQQVERLGFRYHQQRVAARGQGCYRAAETHNDLRTLLANVSNPILEKQKFSKRMFKRDANVQSTQEQQHAAGSRSREANVLNSDGVKNSMIFQSTRCGDPLSIPIQEKRHNNNNNIKTVTSVSEAPVMVTPRVQPSMVSTLPIGWEHGSSWNPTPENAFQTSSQRQNEGKSVAERNLFDNRNSRRLGRNRSVLKSNIVLG